MKPKVDLKLLIQGHLFLNLSAVSVPLVCQMKLIDLIS
jgi:hypothetical protein